MGTGGDNVLVNGVSFLSNSGLRPVLGDRKGVDGQLLVPCPLSPGLNKRPHEKACSIHTDVHIHTHACNLSSEYTWSYTDTDRRRNTYVCKCTLRHHHTLIHVVRASVCTVI